MADKSLPKLAAGLMLLDGAMIAAQITGLDETQVAFCRANGNQESMLLSKVAALLFRPLPENKRSVLNRNTFGLLLCNGDFVEGKAKNLADKRLLISSTVLGIKSYSIEREAVALILARAKKPQ